METQRRIWVAVHDMFFAAKISVAAKRAGVNVEFVQDENKLLAETEPSPAMLIVDLNNAGLNPIELIGKLKANPLSREVRIVGYLSHVQRDLKREAEIAGCDVVLPRSVFSQNLEDLLREHSCHL